MAEGLSALTGLGLCLLSVTRLCTGNFLSVIIGTDCQHHRVAAQQYDRRSKAASQHD